MKLTKVKGVVVFLTWIRIEVKYNCAVYEIPEIFSTTSLGVEVGKLHVIYCIYHFKCFSKMRFIWRSDKEVYRSVFGSDFIRQDSFSFFLVIII